MKTLLFPSFLHLQNGFNKPSLLLNPRQFFFAVIIGLLSVATTSVVNSQSQASYAGANFMASSGAFSPLSGATPVPTILFDDVVSGPLPIGFSFFYMGKAYTQVRAGSDGYLSLYTSGTGTSTTNNLSTGTTVERPVLAPFWDDMDGRGPGAAATYLTTGSVGSRVFTFEWLNWVRTGGTTPVMSFQVKLYESTGIIQYIYRSETGALSGASVSIGTCAVATGSGNFVSLSDAGAAPTTSTTTETTSISAKPTTGQTYTFTPPQASVVAPTSLTFTAVTQSGMTVNWVDNSTNETNFNVFRSTDGVNFTYASTITSTSSATTGNAYNYVASGLAGGTTYYWQIFANSEGVPSTALSGSQATLGCSFPGGTYTVGATGTYTTIAAALAAMSPVGILGPVVLELQTDYVPEGAITFGPIPCASTSNTITIRPAAGVGAPIEFTSAAAAATFAFNGGQYYIIDGRNGGSGTNKYITLTNTSTSGQAVQFINEGSGNTIKYCTIKGVNTSTTGGVVVFGTTTGSNGNDNNTIDVCDIRDGATTPNNCVYSSGTTATVNQNNSGNTVSNCNVFNFFSATAASNGLLITSGNTDWTITGNSIYQTASRTSTTGATHTGISVTNSSTGNNFSITNNFVGGGASGAGGSAWTHGGSVTNRFIGIQLSSGLITASSIQGNTVTNFNWSSSSGATTLPAVWIGIYLSSGSANIGTVTGNTIGSTTGTGAVSVTISTTGGVSAGIGSAATTTYVNISNNNIGSVNVLGSSATVSHSFNGIWTTTATSSTLTINNNTVGSTSTANSIAYTTAGTGTTAAVIQGILNSSSATTLNITNNTIANLNSAYVPAAANTSSIVRGIVSSSGINTISGNTIRNLSTGALGTGTGSTASVIGLSLTSTTASTTISQNTIYALSNTNASGAVWVSGLYYSGASSGNNVVARNNIYGLTLSSTSATAQINGIHIGGGLSVIRNNMITVGAGNANSNLIIGLYESAGTDNIWHNSVYVGGSPTAGAGNSFAFNSTVTSNTRSFRNNNFVNARSNSGATGKHYAVAVGGTGLNPAGLTINNNIYQVTGTGAVFGLYNAADVANIAAWQGVIGQDGNSFENDPRYLDPTNASPDLHINPAINTVVEGNGSDQGVIDDFDGQTRSSLTPVDIGADAGNFMGLDLLAPTITYTALPNTGCTMDRMLTATITDAGGVNNSSGSKPRLYFKKSTDANTYVGNTNADNGWKYVETTSSMSPYLFTTNYALLQSAVVAGDIIQYFVVAQDMAPTPNVAINSGTFNSPPSSVNLMAANFPIGGAINSYTLSQNISGTVMVGAAQTYHSLTEAGSFGLFNAINNNGLAGNLTVMLADPTINETGEIALNAIYSSTCSGGPYTLTIKPSATTTLTGSIATAIIRINAADNVTIDGSTGSTANTLCPPTTASRDLTITNLNTGTSSAVIWLQSNGSDGATNNTIKNCIITGNSNTTTLIGIGAGSSTISTSSLGTGNNNNSIINNQISKVQFGIYTQGASSANKNTGNVINQNVMNTVSPNHISKGAIWTGYENSLTISGNKIGEITQTSVDCFGIALGLTGLTSTSFTGNEVTNAVVTKNIITSLTNTGTFSAGGITVASATSGTNLIANNMISGVWANGTSGDFSAGIILGGGTGSTTQVYYNTIHMNGTITGSTATQTSACVAVTNSTEPVIDLRNNILVNTQVGNSGATLKFACIALGYSTYASLTSNYNDLYCAGPGPGTYQIGITGTVVAGTSRTTLTDWQTATGKDGASLNFLPFFISPTNLHIDAANTINLPLDGAGVAIPAITDDIDCDVRTTDLGVDEFTPPTCSVAMGGTAAVTGASAFCGSGTPTITASGYSNGVGSGYQWMSSTSSGDYPMNGTPVSGQTNPATLSTGVVSVTTYYWLRVTCSTGMSTDYSNMLTITITPLPTATLSPSGTVNICPPVTSQLLTSSTNAMTPSYVWKKDGVTIGGETNSTYTVTVTGAYTVVVTDGATSCSNTSSPTSVVFNPQPTAPIITPSSATMCFGDPAVLLTASGSGGGTGVSNQASANINLTIPDNNTPAGGVSDILTVNNVPVGATIDSVIVTVNITHSFDGDVELNLEAPNGQIINLIADQGSTGINFTNTRLSSNTALNPIPTTATGAPFTGTYRANATNSGLVGTPAVTTTTFTNLFSTPNGNWKIRAYDDANLDVGTLVNWAIKISYTNPPATYTWSPNGAGSGLYSDQNASMIYSGAPSPTVYAKPTSTTVYTATATNGGGCTNSSMVTITVNPAPSVTPGSNPVVCLGASTANLTYSATSGSPDQYSIDFSLAAENQGFVDVVNAMLPASPIVITVPGAAVVGVYSATLSVKNSTTGCVGAGIPISVTIETTPSAGTVSGASPLCIGATTTYSTTGSGGTWTSSNPAVASVHPTTGLVSALTAGSTNITYDVPANNCGPAASNFQALTVSPNVNPGTVSGNSPLCIGVMDTYASNGDVGGTWSSTNTMVATVDAMTGVVTTIGAGTTDIKYTIGTGCGSPAFSMLTLTVSPNVNPGTVSGNTSLCVGSMDTYTSNGDPGGTWMSTNTMVATVDAMTGVVTAVASGTTDIRYSFSAGCGSPVFSFLTLSVAPTTVLNTNDTGAGSLRDIVSCAGDGATISFDASLTGQTILLTSGELIINKNLTFTGLGALNLAISGNGNSRVFYLQPGKTLTITNMKLKDGSSMTDGGAALVDGYLILQDVIFENNLENGIPKSLTVTPAATVEILGNVDLKN